MSQSLNEQLHWRYATKQFDTEKVLPEADLEYILEAGRLTATSYGLQPFKIIVVTDKAIKQTLMGHAYGQVQVGQSGALLVLAARTDIDEAFISEYTARIETTRGLEAGTVNGYKDMMVGTLTPLPPEVRLVWAQKQAYIALGTMLAAAAERKVDSCPMEGFSASDFDTVLGLKEHNLAATVILPLGYRAEADVSQHYAKVRLPLETLVIKK